MSFIDRHEIKLNDSQIKMVKSGFGEDAFNNSVVEKITYLSDGLKIKGYIAYPKNISSKLPLVIWNRGGYKNLGAIDQFTARGMFGKIASEGYVVISSQYRGNNGSEGVDQLGGDDVNDIFNLVDIVSEFDFVDKTRKGIEGWSRGGLMTLLMLLKRDDFKCVILSGAISNFKDYINSQKEKLESYASEIPNFKDEIEKRNIITKVTKLPDIHYLLLHGGKDNIISVNQTLELASKFTTSKLSYQLVIFEEGDHYLKNYREEIDRLRFEWFKKYLSD